MPSQRDQVEREKNQQHVKIRKSGFLWRTQLLVHMLLKCKGTFNNSLNLSFSNNLHNPHLGLPGSNLWLQCVWQGEKQSCLTEHQRLMPLKFYAAIAKSFMLETMMKNDCQLWNQNYINLLQGCGFFLHLKTWPSLAQFTYQPQVFCQDWKRIELSQEGWMYFMLHKCVLGVGRRECQKIKSSRSVPKYLILVVFM